MTIVGEALRASWRVCTALALAIGCAAAALIFIRPEPVAGVAIANQGVVATIKEERAVAAAKQAAADEAAALAALEEETRTSMQSYFSDPVNQLENEELVVSEVGLIKTAENLYEGMATMSRRGGMPRDIVIHVKADGRTSMWSTEPGALAPLFD